MKRRQRKEWLLHLWNYHNGLLTSAEVEEVDRKLAEEVESRLDSQKVRQVIEELRQAGRWETHPTFPEEMVERILQNEGGGIGRWILIAAVVLALIYFFFLRGGPQPPEISLTAEQTQVLSFTAPGRLDETGELEMDFSSLESSIEEDVATSSRLELRAPARLPSASPVN